jgi:hypothetical protein
LNRPAVVSAALVGALLVALSLGMELTPGFGPLRRNLRDGFGPEGGSDSRSVRLLRQLGVDPGSRGWTTAAPDAPSSRSVKDEFLMPGQWLVSVAIQEESLYDPERGILANRHARGRDWERVAWLSVYDGRRLAFATRVGLRYHGGASRGDPEQDAFRVIFRPSYGLPRMPRGGPLKTAKLPPDRFLVRRNGVIPQAQLLAFAIARRVGAVAPAAVPARFVFNGSLRQQPYELTEYVSPAGWGRSFFGHDDFRFYQFRAKNSPANDRAYKELQEWVRTAPRPLTLEQVAERVDTDHLVRHLFTMMYCGTEDWAQGGAVLDLRSPRARWFWVLWDLDRSFRGREVPPWKRPSIELVLDATSVLEKTDVRTRIFRRLLREDPRFVPYFTGLVSEMLNHALTAEYLEDLVRHSERLSVHGVPFDGFDLRGYFAHRGDEILNTVAETLGLPRPHLVDVRAPTGVRLRVDGHEYGSLYKGRYFDGQTVAVQALDSDGTPRGLWSVNGRAAMTTEITLVVDRDTVIRSEE